MGRFAITVWLALGATVGCYDPTPVEGLPCSPTLECPSGQTCDIPTDQCYSTQPTAARLTQIDAGASHTCGIDADGALWCWGANDGGQLGVGGLTDRLVPTRVGSKSDWVQVSAGPGVTCGIRNVSELWCWGLVFHDERADPTRIAGAYSNVSVGQQGFVATTSTGLVYGTSYNDTAPVDGLPAPMVTSFASGHGCIIDGNHKLYCWGVNNRGQCGVGSTTDVDTPAQIGVQDWTTVAAGDLSTCAIATDGGLYCWGDNSVQQLGLDIPDHVETPTRVGSETYSAVDVTDRVTCAIRADRASIDCWGGFTLGVFAYSPTLGVDPTPPIAPELDHWNAIAVGADHVCALRGSSTGDTWCWGFNRHGQLGDGNGGFQATPVQIDAGPWKSVIVGSTNTCAIGTDGLLRCWGLNKDGQIGDGTAHGRNRPTLISDIGGWSAVAPAESHTCGVAGGQLYCWGANDQGQLGVEGSALATPTRVDDNADWVEIATRAGQTCGLRGTAAGDPGTKLWCWGYQGNPFPTQNGDAGYSSLASQPVANGYDSYPMWAIEAGALVTVRVNSTPPETTGINTWQTISPGALHQCGIIAGQQINCYGVNYDGELGYDTADVSGSSVPMSIRGTDTWTAVDAGGFATCAITTEGKLKCWGAYDMLGTGAMTDTSLPTEVMPSAQWASVSVGDHSSCAIQQDGSLWCWGDNYFGELGDGRGGSYSPVRVTSLQ